MARHAAASTVAVVATGSWREWSWDPTLFAGAAPHYDRGRLPYSERLVDVFTAALGLDGTGRLLDVGCGPGTIALRIAARFEEVVGLDPDPEMLAEAERLARERNVTNASWVRRRAEELPAGLGTFRVVVFAQSFHWMDRPLVAATVRTMLDPGGAVVHVDWGERDDLGDIPKDAIDALRRRWLGPDRRAGRSIRNDSPGAADHVFRPAGFTRPELVTVPAGRVQERSVDDVVEETLSMSSTAPHLFGDRLDEFVADLRAVLLDASPSGRFPVRLTGNALRIWHPAP
jgi:SAM-dependent methyltransferase